MPWAAEKSNHNLTSNKALFSKEGIQRIVGYLLRMEPRTSCMLDELASTERLRRPENTGMVRMKRKGECWDSTSQIMVGTAPPLLWDTGSKGSG